MSGSVDFCAFLRRSRGFFTPAKRQHMPMPCRLM